MTLSDWRMITAECKTSNDRQPTSTAEQRNKGDKMTNLVSIYNAMRNSDLNSRVGGSDPEEVGKACYYLLQRHLNLNADCNILDFGCGIGRVMLQILESQQYKSAVGMDIMPEVIEFCEEHLTGIYRDVSFELVSGQNNHYDKYISGQVGKSVEQMRAAYGEQFQSAYAFSVFTHIDYNDFTALLRDVSYYLVKGGKFMFTAFALTSYSRSQIRKEGALFKFPRGSYEMSDSVFIGDRDDRLAFIAYDIALLAQIVEQAGLIITDIDFGAWTGSGVGRSLQDVIVCQKSPD